MVKDGILRPPQRPVEFLQQFYTRFNPRFRPLGILGSHQASKSGPIYFQDVSVLLYENYPYQQCSSPSFPTSLRLLFRRCMVLGYLVIVNKHTARATMAGQNGGSRGKPRTASASWLVGVNHQATCGQWITCCPPWQTENLERHLRGQNLTTGISAQSCKFQPGHQLHGNTSNLHTTPTSSFLHHCRYATGNV